MSGPWRAGLLTAALLAALPAGAAPAPVSKVLEGRVQRVIDGDSLWFEPDAGPAVEVRLLGIDAPEACQDWGPQARRALADRALGRGASLRPQGQDTHGRMLGTLVVDGVVVNQWLVEEGHAWSSRYKWDRGPYVRQERMAASLQRGLHARPGAVEPREFRRRHGPCR